MKRTAILTLALMAFFSLPAPAAETTRVVIATSMGDVVVELDREKAPGTVENFLSYAASGFYDGTVFHRVIKGFMIQGGGLTADLKQKTTRPPIENEAANGLKNLKSTIAMARTGDPHSATSQFFINTVDNPFLDHRNPAPKGWGYCVFGKVVEGMAVVERIEAVHTKKEGGHRDVPVDPVVIRSVTVMQQGT